MSADSILVVGLNRSGTKWLSNILAQSDQVAAVTLAHQFGILESNALHDFRRVFKKIERDDDYAGFVCLWSETDYVRSTGIDRLDILRWKPRPTTVLAALSQLLDELREKQGKQFWLQKCSPFQAQQFLLELGDSTKVISIRRPFNSILESSVALKQQTNANSSFGRDLVVNAIQSRLFSEVSRRPNALTVDFENLKSDPETAVRQVCEFIGIEFSAAMLNTPFKQNTSFEKKATAEAWLFAAMVEFFCARFVCRFAFELGKPYLDSEPRQSTDCDCSTDLS